MMAGEGLMMQAVASLLSSYDSGTHLCALCGKDAVAPDQFYMLTDKGFHSLLNYVKRLPTLKWDPDSLTETNCLICFDCMEKHYQAATGEKLSRDSFNSSLSNKWNKNVARVCGGTYVLNQLEVSILKGTDGYMLVILDRDKDGDPLYKEWAGSVQELEDRTKEVLKDLSSPGVEVILVLHTDRYDTSIPWVQEVTSKLVPAVKSLGFSKVFKSLYVKQ